MKLVSFKIEEKLLEELDRFCKRNKIYRSDAIRLAIKKLLKEGVEIRLKPLKKSNGDLY